MHHKEQAIAPDLKRFVELDLVATRAVDTDALGTFTGEIARKGTMLDAARAKALRAIETTGYPIGIGSEGSFGPDPLIPFFAGGSELLVLVDAERGLEVKEFRRSIRTNYGHAVVGPGDEVASFLLQVRFPSHALIVRPNACESFTGVRKSIVDASELSKTIADMAKRSSDGRAFVGTDMRAHVNPTRMKMIGLLGRRLGIRLARLCPNCAAPGFGLVDFERGLPCALCEEPTRLIRAEVHGCGQCGHRLSRRQRPRPARADPTYCDGCNP